MESLIDYFSQFQKSVPVTPAEMDLKLIEETIAIKPTNLEAVADGNSFFCADLQCALVEELKAKVPIKNVVFSPLSLSSIMAMTKLGARGQTKREIENVFHFPRDCKEMCKGYAEAIASLKEINENFTLHVGNQLHRQENFQIVNKEFRDAIGHSFGAPVQAVTCTNEIDAAEQVHGWVVEATGTGTNKEAVVVEETVAKPETETEAATGTETEAEAEIEVEEKKLSTDVIIAYSLNCSNKLNFVNGVYFKGVWERQFDPKKTDKVKFFLSAKKCCRADMMHTKVGIVPFVEIDALDAKIVALPYKGDRVCMLIYLPRQRAGLAKLEDGLKTMPVSYILQQLKSFKLKEVDVWLPKFRIESNLSLAEPLQKLGIHGLFGAADFSGISLEKISVSQSCQKAFIEVNEGGTEAGVETSRRIPFVSGFINMFAPAVIPFKVEHPFAFQIVDKVTNFILFAGSINNPNK